MRVLNASPPRSRRRWSTGGGDFRHTSAVNNTGKRINNKSGVLYSRVLDVTTIYFRRKSLVLARVRFFFLFPIINRLIKYRALCVCYE